jgi:hypothetical protein
MSGGLRLSTTALAVPVSELPDDAGIVVGATGDKMEDILAPAREI